MPKLQNLHFPYFALKCGFIPEIIVRDRVMFRKLTHHRVSVNSWPQVLQLSTARHPKRHGTRSLQMLRFFQTRTFPPVAFHRRTDAGNLPRIRWCQSFLTDHWPCLSVLLKTKSDTSGFHNKYPAEQKEPILNPPNYALSHRRRAVPNPSYLPQVKLMEIPASPFRRYSIVAHCANSVFPERMLFGEGKSVCNFRKKSLL